MIKISMDGFRKFWTDSVAYVALLVSAGLSLSGNVVDTYRVRGAATDGLDIWLAITWPGLVVLMVHVFVSSRWIGLGFWMQALRWLGCISVGAVACRLPVPPLKPAQMVRELIATADSQMYASKKDGHVHVALGRFTTQLTIERELAIATQ